MATGDSTLDAGVGVEVCASSLSGTLGGGSEGVRGGGDGVLGGGGGCDSDDSHASLAAFSSWLARGSNSLRTSFNTGGGDAGLRSENMD